MIIDGSGGQYSKEKAREILSDEFSNFSLHEAKIDCTPSAESVIVQ